jgi:hypothetical protein
MATPNVVRVRMKVNAINASITTVMEMTDMTLMVRKPKLMLPDIHGGSTMGTGRALIPFWNSTLIISLTAKDVMSSDVTFAPRMARKAMRSMATEASMATITPSRIAAATGTEDTKASQMA